jgi:hypothetical protein
MTTPPVRVERRIGQRFPYLLPVSFRDPVAGIEGLGFTQDVSSRGVFFLTDACLCEGGEIELTLKMPSEITLGDNMRVRCRGRVLRVFGPPFAFRQDASSSNPNRTKIGVAVRFDQYEYLPESAEPESSFSRVAALHSHHEAEEAPVQLSARPAQG